MNPRRRRKSCRVHDRPSPASPCSPRAPRSCSEARHRPLLAPAPTSVGSALQTTRICRLQEECVVFSLQGL